LLSKSSIFAIIAALTSIGLAAGPARCQNTGIPNTAVPNGFGVNIHTHNPQAGEMQMMYDGGIRIVRTDLYWDETETSPGVYNFSGWDPLFTAAGALGIRVMLVLDYTNSLYDGGNFPTSTAGKQAFTNWAKAAVAHFQNKGVIWELYNEPNHVNQNVSATNYANLANAVGAGIKGTYPNEVFVGPALAWFDSAAGSLYTDAINYLTTMFQAGNLNYFDGVTVHPYRQELPEDLLLSDYAQGTSLINQYKPGVPLLCGEHGYTTTWGISNTDALQAKLLARTWLLNYSYGIRMMIDYDWHDDGTDPNNQEHHFGLVGPNYLSGQNPVYTPKLAYNAAKTMTTQLNGYSFSQRLGLGNSTDYVLSFTNGTSTRYAAWDRNNTADTVTIPTAPNATVTITNYTGTTTGPFTAGTGGGYTITLNDTPQYVVVSGGGSPGTFVKGVNLNGAATTIEGNAWLSYTSALSSGLTVTNGSTTTTGITWTPSADANTSAMLNSVVYRSAPPNGQGINLDQTIANGTYNVYFWEVENFQSNFRNEDIYLEGVKKNASAIGDLPLNNWAKYGPYTVTVTDGVLNMLVARSTKGDPLCTGFAIFNASSGAPSAPAGLTATTGNNQVSLSWNAVSGATSYNVYRGTTAGGESATALYTGITGTTKVDTGLTNGQPYFYEVKAVNASGTSGYSNEASAIPASTTATATINYATTAPTIDGNVDTIWNSAPAYPINKQGAGSAATATNGVYQVLWDNTNLYYLFTINDSALVNGSPDWNGDCVEMYIDATNSKTTTYVATDYKYALGYGHTTISEYAHSATTGVTFAQGTYTGGYRKEVKIPWSTLGVTPVSGNSIGLDVATDDGVTVAGGRLSQLFWHDNSTNDYQNPSLFGTGTLTGGTSVPSAPTGLTAAPNNAQIGLSWNAVTGATSYNVYRGTTAGGESATALYTGITGTTKTDTGLTNGTTYFYKVKAVNGAGTSGYSNEATTTPYTPIVESINLALSTSTVSHSGGSVTATVTLKNISASSVTMSLVGISARDASDGNRDFGGPGATTLAAGQTVTLTQTRNFTTADPIGNWIVFTSYQSTDGVWHNLSPTLNLTVTN